MLLKQTIEQAADFVGMEALTVLDMAAETLSTNPAFTASVRIADILLTCIDSFSELQELPELAIRFVGSTLRSAYPPAPRHKVESMWLVRTVCKAVEDCPNELVDELLNMLREGLCPWVEDACNEFDKDEYEYDVSSG